MFHLGVSMILSGDRHGETRKPRAREAVMWLLSQWVAAVGQEPRPYSLARERVTGKEEEGCV